MESDTGRTPKALLDRPILFEDLEYYWEGFWTLHSSRSWTFGGPAPIPVTEIESYLRIVECLDPGMRVEFMRLIMRMDRAWMAAHYRREKSKRR